MCAGGAAVVARKRYLPIQPTAKLGNDAITVPRTSPRTRLPAPPTVIQVMKRRYCNSNLLKVVGQCRMALKSAGRFPPRVPTAMFWDMLHRDP
ncbi:hypothetical protein EVAR_51405_1 [Eumeta japonica]|uniref:Uncharacterized protein n=1 Tax=Eumeta variegata TaxID=151549 RepID=A0A4C1XXF1_EUMVA|nr:hypothetical protein EVAR_51405_1 [Eumeta japonica]